MTLPSAVIFAIAIIIVGMLAFTQTCKKKRRD